MDESTATFRPSRYPLWLLGLFVVYWTAWAIRPVDRKDWLLENALSAAFVMALVLTRRRFPLSNVSYTLIFLYLCLHTIGAHYTYSLVPYDNWSRAVFGRSLSDMAGWQ